VSQIEIEQMIKRFERANEKYEDYALRLLGLAEVVAGRGSQPRAHDLALKARDAALNDPEVEIRTRQFLSTLIPPYHVMMMNDERRNLAWSEAIFRAVRPGSHVLEIGTGAGILAMLAARAGAATVTTCERDPVMARLANEIVERNGYSDRIRIIPKASQALIIGVDLDRRADLLFCDLFSGSLFGHDPLKVLVDARRRLLAPGAPVIPAAGGVRLAIGEWRDYARRGHIDCACGFDVTLLSDFISPSFNIEIGDRDLILRSEAVEALRFDFSACSQPSSDRKSVVLEAIADGVVNVIAQWIRLELDTHTVLEAVPEPSARYFIGPNIFPLSQPLVLRKGDRLRIGLTRSGKRLMVWLVGQDPRCSQPT
jgi:type III protein arginine methyltransferase